MKKSIKSYRDLNVWQKGMDLVDRMYEETENMPAKEMYGLTSQMRRAAVSVPSNIAEGHAKRRGNYFATHLDTALGSLAELDTQLEICLRRRFIKAAIVRSMQGEIEELQRMAMSLQEKIETRN